jgi:PAS domain S-box-containing protein
MLRKRAEALVSSSPEAPCTLTPEEVRTLVHDLSVHQIELELQNDELLQAQLQIERTRDELARLYHQAPVGYLTLNRSGTIERCNQTFADMVGKSLDLVINKPLADLLDNPERTIFLGRFRAFYNQPADKAIDLYFPAQGSGKGFHGRLTASISRHSPGQLTDEEPSLLVIVQDISEQRIEALFRLRAEEKLKTHDLFVSTLLDTVPIPIFYKDAQCRYLGCNKAFRAFTGLNDEQLIGKTVFDIAVPENAIRYDESDKELLANPGSQSYEWKVVGSDGSLRTVVFNKATFSDANGEVSGIVGAIQDITGLKELQDCMSQAKEAAEQACEQKDLPVTVVQDGHRPENYRILLVEDDYVNQRVMDTMLRKMGYRTGLAANGKEALDLLAAETFDLILMDCSMPVLDGYLSTEKIREPTNGVKNSEMPIIALTARAMQGDREKCLKAGMNDYLPKPVRFDELTTVLNRWLAPK